MKLISILIPTYNRSNILPDAVNSITKQIESFNLSSSVDIIICNDCSPDDTSDYLLTLKEQYIISINRPHNLGMSDNIRTALKDNCKSEWVLILTDDDTMEANMLPSILEKCRELSTLDVAICLTPRYSYLENGKLHCISCQSFNQDTLIKPEPISVGQVMSDGFILSGILLRPEKIDYSMWIENIDNSMFPVIFTGATLQNQHGYYWATKIINHTVLNECFWARWGKNQVDREYRLLCDCIETYSILSRLYRNDSSDKYNEFWKGATPKIKNIYGFYLSYMPSGMSGLVDSYGLYLASQMIAKTIFDSHCFWAIFLFIPSNIKYFIKLIAKAILLRRRLKLIDFKTLLAHFLILIIILVNFKKI